MGKREEKAFGSWPEYGNASAPQGSVTVGQGVIPWDPIAVAYLLEPEWFGGEKCFEMQLSLNTNPPVMCSVE